MDGAINVSELAQAIAQAVREALSGMAIYADKTALGYVAAEAINENRRAEGRIALDL